MHDPVSDHRGPPPAQNRRKIIKNDANCFVSEREREREREETGSDRAIIKAVGPVSHAAFNYLRRIFPAKRVVKERKNSTYERWGKCNS